MSPIRKVPPMPKATDVSWTPLVPTEKINSPCCSQKTGAKARPALCSCSTMSPVATPMIQGTATRNRPATCAMKSPLPLLPRTISPSWFGASTKTCLRSTVREAYATIYKRRVKRMKKSLRHGIGTLVHLGLGGLGTQRR